MSPPRSKPIGHLSLRPIATIRHGWRPSLRPGVAAMGDDIVINFTDAVGEPVLAHEVPEMFDRIELWRFRRQRQDCYVGGHIKCLGHVPARVIQNEDGIRVIGDMAGISATMLCGGVGIAARHDESRRIAELGADCTEDVDGSRSLVVRRARS